MNYNKWIHKWIVLRFFIEPRSLHLSSRRSVQKFASHLRWFGWANHISIRNIQSHCGIRLINRANKNRELAQVVPSKHYPDSHGPYQPKSWKIHRRKSTSQTWSSYQKKNTSLWTRNSRSPRNPPISEIHWIADRQITLSASRPRNGPGFMTDFQSLAVLALQKASEAYLVALSSNTPICVPFTQNVSPSCPRISSCWLEGSKKRARKSHLAKAFGVRIREVRL